MDRISDEQLDTLIDFLAEDIKTEKRPVFFVTHSALVELRERRAAEKKAVSFHDYCADREPDSPNTAQWADFQCPKCGSYYVAQDRFGYRCVAQECGWTKDEPIITDAVTGRKILDRVGI